MITVLYQRIDLEGSVRWNKEVITQYRKEGNEP